MSILSNSIQAGISSLEQGIGRVIVRTLLVLMLGLGVYAAYSWSHFRGLDDPAAMEYAQLARNLATGKGLTTQCIRPVDLWHFKHVGSTPELLAFPDIRHAPFWPSILATGFRIFRPSFAPPSRAGIFEPERRVVIPLGIAISLATGLLILWLGNVLFGPRTALVAVVFIFLNGALLKSGISGSCIPTATFFVTAAFCAAVFAVRFRTLNRPWHNWLPCVILCGLFSAAAFLTTYGALVVLPVLILWLWTGAEEVRRITIPVLLVVFALTIMPWLIRNRTVAGATLGMAPYEAMTESLLFPHDSFDRSLSPNLHNVRTANAMKHKIKANAKELLDSGFGLTGAGIMAAFFLVSLLHRFEEEDANRLKWHMLLGLALISCLVAVRGIDGTGLLYLLFPLVILSGTAFFFVMANRLTSYQVELQAVILALVITVAASGYLLGIAGQRAPLPYPPYYPPLNAYAAQSVNENEILCTDIPQATAWYGNRTSVLLPNSVDEFREIDGTANFSALYLASTAAANSTLPGMAGKRPWKGILDRTIPEGFPLTHGVDLPPGTTDQLLLLARITDQSSLPADR